MIKPHARTDFSQYSHEQLIAMLYAADPASVRSAGDQWDQVGQYLHAQAGDLDQQLNGFDQKWSGSAAAQYHVMMKDLSGGVRTVADNAFAMRDVVHDSADALDTARAQMPQPVSVPAVDPATMSLASTPVTVPADASPAQVAAVQQQQAQAAAAVQQQQQAQAGADAAHAQAVKVMTALADHYTVDQDNIPQTPSASGAGVRSGSGGLGAGGGLPEFGGSGSSLVPLLDASGVPILGADGQPVMTDAGGSFGSATDGSGGSGFPVTGGIFGGMFAAGIAAASAASFGRFGSILPRVPGFAGGGAGAASRRKDDKSGRSSTGPTTLPTGAGAGGGGVDLGGGGGVGGVDAPGAEDPTAYHGMAGGSSGLTTGLTAAAAAGPLAARAASSMGGFMPAMPMGAGMGGGDTGGTKRIPPWLVETEDVWGEQSAVSPSVIGDEPPVDDSWLR